MKKKSVIVICAISMICVIAALLVMRGTKGDISEVNRIVGDSALYDENSINKAFDIIEEYFEKEFDACTLTELRYDSEVENKFTDVMRYAKEEESKVLIVILSTFDTDKRGGDGSLNPDYTYIDWRWQLIRTTDLKSWQIISYGY